MPKSREELVEEALELGVAQLYALSDKARDPKVVDIRKKYERTGQMSRAQAAVLAGWQADQIIEYGMDGEEDDDE